MSSRPIQAAAVSAAVREAADLLQGAIDTGNPCLPVRQGVGKVR